MMLSSSTSAFQKLRGQVRMLDYFALLVLLILGIVMVAGLVVIGMMPGRIARERHHPQADAISVCGWWGLVTLGILLPLAYIWAYTRVDPASQEVDQ